MTKPNGTTYPLATKRTATKISSAKQTMQLLGDDVLNISVVSPFPQSYGIGDKTTVFGRVYKINQLPKVKKNGMREFTYDITLEGIQYDLLRVCFDLTIDTTDNTLQDVQADTLTGDLRRFATVLFSNANRVFPGKWVLGTCPDSETKTLTFSESDNCLSVLQSLCQESNFNIEFEISQNNGVNTVNFKKVGQVFPYTFQFGKGNGIYTLDRQNVSSSSIITRLKVYGSSDNITSKYRAKRLCLPGKTKAQSYIEEADAIAKYGVIEGKKFFDDIKPTFKGTITSLVSGSVIKFVDTSMFDLNAKETDGTTTKYLLDGVSAKIHFNTGNLAGYEFEVKAYDHATHTFTLAKQTDDRGDSFPSESSIAFQFAKGDEYKILDVALPETYEQAAESELLEDGTTYYQQNSQPKVKYGLTLTKAFLEKKFGSDGTTVNIFVPGDYIPVKDADIDVDKSVRIQSFVRDLLDEYNYQLTISDTVTTTTINRVVSDLIDIDKIININDLKDPARAKANWRTSREVLDMVFDPDGDYYTDKIKPNSIDTMCLSVGAKSMQFGLQNTSFQPNFQGNANVVKVTGGVLTHYTIVEDGTKSWVLADNQTTLNENVAFYIYAKCSKTDTSGSIIFSKQAIKVEEDASNYHFLIGVLNSVDTTLNVRSIYLQYGFTMINGRFIKTGRIESADGTTYFDLDNSEIGGRIVFSQNGQDKTLAELGNEALESKNYINNTLPGILDEIQSQLDGQIEQFFYTYDPTSSNPPAMDWTTTALKENHLGDLFYNTDSGKVFRWIKNGTMYSWQQLQDSEVAQALALANDALALSKTKRRIFTSTPYTPYEIGDLWVQGTNGDIMRCKSARATGSYTSSDWEKASNYTSDAALTTFINGAYTTAIDNLTTQIDGKIETWFQTSDPASSWTSNAIKAKHVGDMWFNSSANKLKRYSSSYAWVEITDQTAIDAYNKASTAQDTADGKRRVFVAQPYPPYDIGDLWVNGTDLRRCATARSSRGSYNVNDWVTCVAYDNTKTVIDGGLVTSGTIQVAGDNTTILAGMTGQGTAADSVRFWAGASFENRATAPFRVMQDGSVVMTKATVEGVIKAISGTIGGFEIASGRIGNVYGSDSGLALYNNFIRFLSSGSGRKYAAIGDLGIFGYDNLAHFDLSSDSTYDTLGSALFAKCRAGNGSMDYWYPQRALEISGNVYGSGKNCFFEEGYIGQAYTDSITTYFKVTHKYHFTANTTSYLGVNLPTKTQIENVTGKSNIIFDVEIVCDRSMANRLKIKSQTGAQMYNNDGNAIDGLDMERGDVLILRYYNGGYMCIQKNYSIA